MRTPHIELELWVDGERSCLSGVTHIIIVLKSVVILVVPTPQGIHYMRRQKSKSCPAFLSIQSIVAVNLENKLKEFKTLRKQCAE